MTKNVCERSVPAQESGRPEKASTFMRKGNKGKNATFPTPVEGFQKYPPSAIERYQSASNRASGEASAVAIGSQPDSRGDLSKPLLQ
jgi:hypothetical protein